jgi:NTP pyrophosphatase (non-canonical NTP hydrolase)
MSPNIIDKNVFNVVCQYAERAQKGFEKYGVTTERKDIDLLGWLQHLQEELMDATVYIERLKHELKCTRDCGQQLCANENKQQHKGETMQLNGSVDDYLEATHQTAIYPEAGTGRDLELYYLSLGLTSEAGEVAGKVKKLIRDGKLNQGDLAYELGDVFWYLVRLCDAIGYSPSDVMDININKLLKRKDSGTIQGSGDHR